MSAVYSTTTVRHLVRRMRTLLTVQVVIRTNDFRDKELFCDT